MIPSFSPGSSLLQAHSYLKVLSINNNILIWIEPRGYSDTAGLGEKKGIIKTKKQHMDLDLDYYSRAEASSIGIYSTDFGIVRIVRLSYTKFLIMETKRYIIFFFFLKKIVSACLAGNPGQDNMKDI